MGVLRIVCAGLALSTSLAQAATFFTEFSQLPTDVYDFVIIGAGAAGNVMAARLTENSRFNVLVIEAGISNEDILSLQVPFIASSNVPATAVTWNYTTIPQAGLHDRVLTYPRGRVVGGTASINFMTYTRGSNDEYDRWAKLTGDSGWSWKNLAPYYLKTTRLVPSVDGHDTAGQVDPKVHGNGPVEVSVYNFASETDSLVIRTGKTDLEFPFNLDIQSGNPLGVSYAQSTVGGGKRSNSATGYLAPALTRKNLHVLIQNTVTRLIPTGPDRGVPVFKRVEFAASAKGKRFSVTAKKEVILSAGSVGTPQILLLSGIGDAKELSTLGIKPAVNLPDVGKHLQDHPLVSNFFAVSSNNTFDDILRNQSLFNAGLAQWQKNHTGIFANCPGSALAFLRVPKNNSAVKEFGDPSAGSHTPHIEMIFSNGYTATVDPQPATGHFLSINTVAVTPLSVGSIRLASADPFAFPLINPNLLDSPFDQALMIESVRTARRFLQTKPWQGFIVSPIGRLGAAHTDAEILNELRDLVVTVWHPTSTARMSPRNATWGVVDPQLRVKGTSGLRVVDASVMPFVPAAHTTGPVYIIAERAADLIKQAWK